MPCYTSLSSVRKTRTIHHVLGPVSFGPQWHRSFNTRSRTLQQDQASASSQSSSTPRPRPRTSQSLARFSGAIDPQDLTATLESHRNANRSSLIRAVFTATNDPETVRPSFLKTRRPEERHAPAQHGRSRSKPNVRTKEAHSHSTPDELREKKYGEQFEVDCAMGHRLEFARRKFLQENKHLLVSASEGSSTPQSHLETMRSVRQVIRRKQATETTGHMGFLKSVPEQLLEYEGRNIPPILSYRDASIPEPWAHRPPGDNYTPRQRLEHEIDLFTQWIKPTKAEQAARTAVRDEVVSLVNLAVPQISTKSFGSQTTGLALPMSDLDIRLYSADPAFLRMNDEKKKKAIIRAAMLEVCDTLHKHPDFTPVARLYSQHPLLEVTHAPSGLTVQLVSSSSTGRSQNMIKAYLAQYPTLKPLFLVIKTLLDMRGLTQVWLGGLGSYTIFIMVVASLKHTGSKPSDPISQQLLDFLDFYAKFKYAEAGLSVEPVVEFKKKTLPSVQEREEAKRSKVLQGQIFIRQPYYYQRYLLCLQDPADAFNDLGKSGFAIKNVKATLRSLSNHLRNVLYQDGARPNQKSNPECLLRSLVGRCDQIYDDKRAHLDLYGESVLEQAELAKELAGPTGDDGKQNTES